MVSVMGRIRVYFDADEALKLAIHQEALRAGKTIKDFVEEILKEYLADAFVEAEKIIANRPKSEAKKPARKKPGAG